MTEKKNTYLKAWNSEMGNVDIKNDCNDDQNLFISVQIHIFTTLCKYFKVYVAIFHF